MFQIWGCRFNSEFGMRNSELRGEEKESGNISAAISNNPFWGHDFLRQNVHPKSDFVPPFSIIPNSEFRIPNFGRRPLNCNLSYNQIRHHCITNPRKSQSPERKSSPSRESFFRVSFTKKGHPPWVSRVYPCIRGNSAECRRLPRLPGSRRASRFSRASSRILPA